MVGNLTRLHPKDQPQNQMFEMSIRFIADIGLTELDEIAERVGIQEKIRAKDAVTLRITQTVPFIPDDELLAQYVETLQEIQNKKGVSISNLKFDGYDYLYAIDIDDKACQAAMHIQNLQLVCDSDLLDCNHDCDNCAIKAFQAALSRHLPASDASGVSQPVTKENMPAGL